MAKEPRTRAARALIAELEKEARHWDDVTTTDAPAVIRNRAEAFRDALDGAITRLRTYLPDIEDEAVDIEVSESARLDAILDSVTVAA